MAALEALAEEGLEPLRAELLGADVALATLPAVTISAEDALRFCGGQAVEADAEGQTGLASVYAASKRFLGVGELAVEGMLAPRRVFQTQEKTP
jgi:hypothetical protein